MEHNIGVGLIVGLVTASSFYIYRSEKFSSVQKTILLICVIFPPAQWLGILIVLAYNNFIENNSVEKITERKNENKINTLNSQVENLKDLKEKGILTNEEYNQKVEKLEAEKAEHNLKNSTEYKQLKSLLDSGVLTKEEFESKVEFIINKNKILIESIGQYLSQKDLNIIKSNYNKNNKYYSKEIRNKLEEVLKIKTNLNDNELIEIVINELENKNP
jgi:hypothetical protein